MTRQAVIETMAKVIHQTQCPHPLRVAIDGVDASGKTYLADELAQTLQHTHRQVIRASVDNFHNPESVRRAKGGLSPQGFYLDSYDYSALVDQLLLPLGPNGDRRYRTASFDYRQDKPITPPFKTAKKDAILLMDGIFLLRPRLLPFWDLTLYVDADFKNTMARGTARDAELFGSIEKARVRYQQRYIPGQRLYLRSANPLDKADILIDNNNLRAPEIIRVPNKILIETETKLAKG